MILIMTMRGDDVQGHIAGLGDRLNCDGTLEASRPHPPAATPPSAAQKMRSLDDRVANDGRAMNLQREVLLLVPLLHRRRETKTRGP